MRSYRTMALCIAVVAATLCACVPSISGPEAAELEKAVRPMLDNMCQGGGSVSASAWPPPLQEVHPDSVWVTTEGMYARTSKVLATERGVFVACHPEQFEPRKGADPSYEAVQAGVYTY